jgi:hypothetical protein
MNHRRRTSVLISALALGLLAAVAPAVADPPQDHPVREQQPRDLRVDRAPDPGAGKASDVRGVDRAFPRQTVLEEPPADPSDAAIKLGLVPYHEIAPALNDLQQASDRVSAEVIAETARGRDVYLVTVTSPESPGEARRQEQLRRRIVDQAAQAAGDASIVKGYKAPVFFNGNIHGNEFEGADASLRVIEDLATSEDPAVESMLDRTRLYFVVTMNPDGRVANTRANGNGFDMNRDFITGSQPEVRGVRQALIDTQPLVMLDLHGYVNGTLIEPTTPPHGENYEYDLFIKHAYPNGLAMEAAVNGLGYTPAADGVQPAVIPFRDWDEGWDDWPPIFTPQYAAFHGTVSHTIEIPLRVNNASYNLPVEELRRRSAINTDIAEATVRASIAYVDENRAELIADQIEIFRRGAAGEAQREVGPELFPEIGPEDVYTTDFPRAYVIPAGADQRSTVAAARLVDHLVANDVDVERATKAFSAGGREYAAGSYVVDMHQPKRGLANVILDEGSDISDRVDQMYDISGWSLGLLWGATVDTVEDGGLAVVSKPVAVADGTGSVEGSGPLELRLDDPKDVEALNFLLGTGTEVQWTDQGSVVLPDPDPAVAADVADRYGVVLRAAGSIGGTPMEETVIAAAAPADELFALAEMGFTVQQVSTATLNSGFDWTGVDTLFVSSGLSYAALTPQARADLTAFLQSGGGVVTRGATGATFNQAAGLLVASRVAGRPDANGVVRVDNSGGPLTVRATPHTFVSAPSWFTGLGSEVTVEQSYGTDGPLVSGHWRARPDGTGGPEAARGQAVVVRGEDETGAGVVLFGSEPLYRAHPKGQYALVGRALVWATL